MIFLEKVQYTPAKDEGFQFEDEPGNVHCNQVSMVLSTSLVFFLAMAI